MTLQSGQRLGPYEIIGALGEGGMGQVYRARDTKLDREVAIKVLPPQVANDASALARFEREAKAVAALSHPNILAIHDFGSIDDTTFAVTELLEGETLRDRMAEGALGPRKAAELGSQIARGLGAAHEKGVIHRDLKPENVMITRDGHAKILDFGLAARAEEGAEAHDGKTQTSLTSPGTVMGTVGYMAPEQVRAKPTDARTDIFSFGTVLYEMLTGRRAFQRETNAETMTAILREEPTEFSASGLSVPPTIAAVVRRCLEKRPEERFHSARDVAFALEALGSESSTGGHAAADLPEVTPSRGAKRVPAIGGALLLAVAAFVGGRLLAPGGAAPDAAVVTNLVQLTFESGTESQPAISPDGKSLAYVMSRGQGRDIFVKRVGGESTIELTPGDERQGQLPAFSPDGESIAYASPAGGVYVMGATGESARRLSDLGANPAWSPDGRYLVVATESIDDPAGRQTTSTLWRIDVETGEREGIVIDGQNDAVQPNWSPNGQRIAFWGLPAGSGRRTLFTVPAQGGVAVQLTDDDYMNWNPVWAPDGRWLMFTSNRGGVANVWRIPIDERSGVKRGPPQAVTISSEAVGMFDVAGDGSIVFSASKSMHSLSRWPLDPATLTLTGEREILIEGTRELAQVSVSPDGKWVAMMDRGVEEDIVVAATDGNGVRRLTNDSFKDRQPVWTSDSRRIVFFSDRSGRYQAWWVGVEGGGLEQLTDVQEELLFNPFVSPDGGTLLYQSFGGGKRVDLAAPHPVRTAEPLPRLPDDRGFVAWDWSPDGTRIVGAAADELYSGGLWLLHTADDRFEKLTDDGILGRFLPDSRTVLYGWNRGVRLIDVASRESRVLHAAGPAESPLGLSYDSDGRHLYATSFETQGDVWLLRAATE